MSVRDELKRLEELAASDDAEALVEAAVVEFPRLAACLTELLDLCDAPIPTLVNPPFPGEKRAMLPLDTIRAVIARHFPTQEDGG
jgi:hypothetical protein